MLVAVAILVVLFSVQHFGVDKVGWLFAPVVFVWFLLIGGIGIFNIWKYDSSVLKAFSPVHVYRFFRKGHTRSSLGGIMLCITGKFFTISCDIFFFFLLFSNNLFEVYQNYIISKEFKLC